ncbi:Hypothetical predicted protein [Podarcis lilfordi]|uniref:Uncharacterized protein n=1 Tax=Podarcis lilfordi TaxID=74358 RepID=A0AA35NXK1_9SAUR|nr:Hypothetical predicted protein [Podarcis lilfordi]
MDPKIENWPGHRCSINHGVQIMGNYAPSRWETDNKSLALYPGSAKWSPVVLYFPLEHLNISAYRGSFMREITGPASVTSTQIVQIFKDIIINNSIQHKG